MIKKGDRVVLETAKAVYAPCTVISNSKDSITITYFAGMKFDKNNREEYEDHTVEFIPTKDIVKLERRDNS